LQGEILRYNPLCLLTCLLFMLPNLCWAAQPFTLGAINTAPGMLCIFIFVLSYTLVIIEEFIHLRKSKPVILASGLIWMIVAIMAKQRGLSHEIEYAVKHNILEYGELFLFLLVAMTYVNAMTERGAFDYMRSKLVKIRLSFRQIFWVTGIISFFLSPIVDNLTTALLMCAVVMAVGKNNAKFISISCVNIVLAANSGGAYSPFGDITTLMVWQKKMVTFTEFFHIFIPSIVSYVIPAFFMSFFVSKDSPAEVKENIVMLHGAKFIMFLFLCTIATTVSFKSILGLPPVVGMMTGLSYLKFFGYYLKMRDKSLMGKNPEFDKKMPFDVFKKIEQAEWDTLMFFYGVILCVGGLAFIGYLQWLSVGMYEKIDLGLPQIHQQTPANIIMGLISAVIDNIPVMFAVLTMQPDMSLGQWLLITLTAGIGGSALSVGSAAGVALMGQARGFYTFFSHLKWTPIILIGYAAGIATHIYLNDALFFVESSYQAKM